MQIFGESELLCKSWLQSVFTAAIQTQPLSNLVVS